MTRIASIMGVATVAALVLLSSCEVPVTDYAEDLAGTWTATIEGRTLQVPGQTGTVPGSTAVGAVVTRTDTNKGTVSLTVADTPQGAPAPAVTTMVTGKIEVTASEIKVSDVDVTPPEVLAGVDPQIAAALTAGLTLTYDLSGDQLTVGNATLFPVLLGSTDTEITLTKQ